ncbi:MAG: hypothetical protein WBA05_15295 [Gordonia sp. (in: high G+C Gram-positive bacteria)]|uniref:hypothetical protein n=1 Tax=Gordonia TaxID=2053 RepID=UPI003267F9D9
MIAENELSAQINRLAPFSDAKAPTLVKLNAARDTITSLLGYMREHDLIPAAILPAVSDPETVANSPTVPVAAFQIGKPVTKLFAKKP